MSLHTKYRPKTFNEVIGHDSVIHSIEKILEKNNSNAFLFTGPSGCGKTTLCRIIAKEVGCEEHNITEVDAATHSGVEETRNLIDYSSTPAFGKSKIKAVIIDEVHSLSKAAFQSLLKSIEEPPSHLYWFLATTEVSKVPKTIKTRCSSFTLSELSEEKLYALLSLVSSEEGFNLSEDILSLIANSSEGSPRKALVNLAMVSDISEKKDAIKILESCEENSEVIELCRVLANPKKTWHDAVKVIKGFEGIPAESARIIVTRYFSSVVQNNPKNVAIERGLNILQAFSEPYNDTDGYGPLFLSLGEVYF